MTYNIRSGAIRWQIYDFLSDGNSNVYYVAHRLRDIRKWRKMPKFDLENEGQNKWEEKPDLRHSTRDVRFHIGEYFQKFNYLITYV